MITTLLSIITISGMAQDVKFKLKGIEDYTGVVRIAVYKNETDYKKESTKMKYTFEKKTMVFGVMDVSLDLEPGKYVIAFLDDRNTDAKMNYNLVGIPKEGYAFSRIVDYGYSRPSFKEAVIEVEEGKLNTFDIRFNYF